jgi:hypothetical protein
VTASPCALLASLREAARDPRGAARNGNRFAELGCDAGRPALGWVEPPSGPEVRSALERAAGHPVLVRRRRYLFCGTGGWIHAVRAAVEAAAGAADGKIFTLHSLDPRALPSLLSSLGDLRDVACCGISASRETLETRLLLDTLRARLTAAGLRAEHHLAWLSSPVPGGQAEDGLPVLDLTLPGWPDVGALFGAPHTLAFLLPLALALGIEKTVEIWETYLARREEADQTGAAHGLALDAQATDELCFSLPAGAGHGLETWVLQLARQGLGGKRPDFTPQIRLRREEPPPGGAADRPGPLATMLTLRAAQCAVAILGARRGIAFAAHPNVLLYKQRIPESEEALRRHGWPAADAPPWSFLNRHLADWIAGQPDARRVEVVAYLHLPPEDRQRIGGELRDIGLPVRVDEGSDWNHHSFQAAVGERHTLFALLDPLGRPRPVPGIPDHVVERNLRTLKAIARATTEALGDRARLFAATL